MFFHSSHRSITPPPPYQAPPTTHTNRTAHYTPLPCPLLTRTADYTPLPYPLLTRTIHYTPLLIQSGHDPRPARKRLIEGAGQTPEAKRVHRSEENASLSAPTLSYTPKVAIPNPFPSHPEEEKWGPAREGVRPSQMSWIRVHELVGRGDPHIFQALEENEEFRSAVMKDLARSTLSPKEISLQVALQTFKNYPPAFQAQSGFLHALAFKSELEAAIRRPELQDPSIFIASSRISHHHYPRYLKVKCGQDPDGNLNTPGVHPPYTLALDNAMKISRLQKKLGGGAFKAIKKALFFGENPAESRLYVVSKQKIMLDWAAREIRLLEKCRGEPNVAQVVNHHTYSDKRGNQVQVMIMPYYETGDLFNFFATGKFAKLSTQVQLLIAADIVRGVRRIHRHNIVHRDLKPENIFLTHGRDLSGYERPIALVGDLGLAHEWGASQAAVPNVGTLEYTPPEVLEGNRHEQIGDAWSVGLILSLCFRSCYPYDPAKLSQMETKWLHILESARALRAIPPPANGTIDWIIWGLTRPTPEERLPLTRAQRAIERLPEYPASLRRGEER